MGYDGVSNLNIGIYQKKIFKNLLGDRSSRKAVTKLEASSESVHSILFKLLGWATIGESNYYMGRKKGKSSKIYSETERPKMLLLMCKLFLKTLSCPIKRIINQYMSDLVKGIH